MREKEFSVSTMPRGNECLEVPDTYQDYGKSGDENDRPGTRSSQDDCSLATVNHALANLRRCSLER